MNEFIKYFKGNMNFDEYRNKIRLKFLLGYLYCHFVCFVPPFGGPIVIELFNKNKDVEGSVGSSLSIEIFGYQLSKNET